MIRIQNPYKGNGFFKNPHFNTIYPHLFRKGFKNTFERRRFELSDGDFVDLDELKRGSDTIMVLLHGLEGSSSSHYIQGMTNALKSHYDVLVMNQRGCSGEDNRLFKSYHSGKTDDLHEVISQLTQSQYKNIHIVGFSMGGNQCLKYAGEQGSSLHPKIKGLVALSVPCDLHESAHYLSKASNWLYMRRFMKNLKIKARAKAEKHPTSNLSIESINKCSTFEDFDNIYTAPANGYDSATHYWKENSSKQFIPNIQRNTLILNSHDDPFFGPKCMPIEESKKSSYVQLEITAHGGHVGFSQWNLSDMLWHEERTLKFIQDRVK